MVDHEVEEQGSELEPWSMRSMIAEILHELRLVRIALQSTGSNSDPVHAQLIEAIAETMAPFDLEFTTAEVLEARATSHALDAALCRLQVTDTAGLGALFRSLRDREFDGLRLVRDGRGWRLVRT